MKSRVSLITLLFLMISVAGIQNLHAQQQRPTDNPDNQDYSSRTRALEEIDSRAAKEAERLVSLQPDKIILLLQQEPGLFLEVKKMIVRKAFAQGRVIDPKELTDDAIFRMVRDDEETRALITQQIVDRGYVRAKPTREELAREFEDERRLENASSKREGQGNVEQNEETEEPGGASYGQSPANQRENPQ